MRGSKVGDRITERLQQVEDQQQELVARLDALEEAIQTATTNREQAYTRLAEIYLPELGDEAVARVGQLVPELHQKFLEILGEKRDRRASVDKRIVETRQQRAEAHRSLQSLTERIEQKAEERDALAAAVQAELSENADYQADVEEAKQANQRYLQARRRLEAAIAERDEKTPAYRADSLFGYLLKRGYGGSAYRATILTRRLDDWVAGKVEFDLQKQGYDLLMEAPAVMEKESGKRAEELRVEVADVEAIEREAADRHGLTRVLADGESLYQERVSLVTHIEDLDASFEDLVTEQTELADTRGVYYRKAIDQYTEFLETQVIEDLRSLARSTETRSDDGLSDEIASLDDEIRRTQLEVDDTEHRRGSLAIKLKGLKSIQTKFYNRDFDARNSRFLDTFDVDGLLDSYFRGDCTTQEVIDKLDAQQFFHVERRPRRDESDFFSILFGSLGDGSFGSSRSGGFGGWGGGFGGGGSSTSGGFGGGGSRTTGGFG